MSTESFPRTFTKRLAAMQAPRTLPDHAQLQSDRAKAKGSVASASGQRAPVSKNAMTDDPYTQPAGPASLLDEVASLKRPASDSAPSTKAGSLAEPLESPPKRAKVDTVDPKPAQEPVVYGNTTSEAVPVGANHDDATNELGLSSNQLRLLLQKVLVTPGALDILIGNGNVAQSNGGASSPITVPDSPTPVAANIASAESRKQSGSQQPAPAVTETTHVGAAPVKHETSPKYPPSGASFTAPQNTPATPKSTLLPSLLPPATPSPPSTSPATSSPPLFLQDVDTAVDPFAIPETCEANDASLQDPLLATDYVPGVLTNVIEVEILGFNGRPADNFYQASDWSNTCPEINMTSVLAAIQFDHVPGTRYINAARIDPRLLRAQQAVSGGRAAKKPRRQLTINNVPAVALTPMYVTESHVVNPPSPSEDGRPSLTKYLAGFLHGQEYQRMAGCYGMVFRQKQFLANLYYSTIPFATIPRSNDFSGSPRKTRSARTYYRGSGANVSPSRTYLLTDEDIPVYDASNFSTNKGRDFILKELIESIGKVSDQGLDAAMREFGLERIEGEIEGACAVVAHTVNVSPFAKDGLEGEAINFNILWAVVLGWDAEGDN